MIPNTHRMFNFDLGETADAIRETVHAFSQNEIAPRAAEIDRSNQFPRDLWPKIGALGLHGITVEEEYGGTGLGLSRALHCGRGDVAGVGRGRPVVWRAFQPLRQPDPPQRQRGAEAEIPAKTDFRRTCRRARNVGARRRLRRGLDEDPRREEGRPLCAQRQQDVDHQRPRRRYAGGLRQDQPRGRSARHDRLHHRKGHEGIFHRAEARQARHARLRHLRTGIRGLRGARRERAQ